MCFAMYSSCAPMHDEKPDNYNTSYVKKSNPAASSLL